MPFDREKKIKKSNDFNEQLLHFDREKNQMIFWVANLRHSTNDCILALEIRQMIAFGNI